MTTIRPVETDRLILREFTVDDWLALHLYGSDPEVMKGLLLLPNSEEHSREVVNQFISYQHEEPRTRCELAITLASTGELIGASGSQGSVAQKQRGLHGLRAAQRLLGKGVRHRGR